MGFFNQIFGNKEENDQSNNLWREIESLKDLDLAIDKSYQQKVLIFKHSTRCFISKTVLKNFEKQIQDSDKNNIYFFLDLITYRSISNEIESRLDVAHQSPQLIVLENGKAVYNASHQNIDLDKI